MKMKVMRFGKMPRSHRIQLLFETSRTWKILTPAGIECDIEFESTDQVNNAAEGFIL